MDKLKFNKGSGEGLCIEHGKGWHKSSWTVSKLKDIKLVSYEMCILGENTAHRGS